MVSLLGLSSPSQSPRCFFDINSCVGFIGASILITAQTQNFTWSCQEGVAQRGEHREEEGVGAAG